MLELMAPTAPAPESRLELGAGEVQDFTVRAGQFLGITVVSEPVIASLYVFAESDPTEWLSVGNTRILLGTLHLRTGHRLFSNRRRALLVWVDGSGGRHDLLLPPCTQLAENAHTRLPVLDRLDQAFTQIGANYVHVPDPLNLFLDTRIDANGRIVMHPPNTSDHALLRATTDLRCVILPWSVAEKHASADRALAIAITNRWPAAVPAISD